MSLSKTVPLPDGWHRGWALYCPGCGAFAVDHSSSLALMFMEKEKADKAAQNATEPCLRCGQRFQTLYVRFAVQPVGECRCS